MKKPGTVIDISQRLLPFQQSIVVPSDKAYCVYTHSHQGTVFYVGKGTPSRPFADGRNELWQQYVQQISSYEISIILWTDDEDLAYQEEARLIHALKPCCNLQYVSLETSSNAIPFALRLPQELHATLQALAQHEHRSLNSQIITMLLEALKARSRQPPQ